MVTLCVWRFKIVRNAYGSVSLPSTFTVEPRSGCDRIKSTSADRLNNSASASKSWRQRDFRPWKSTSGDGSNHSNSTLTMSMSCLWIYSDMIVCNRQLQCTHLVAARVPVHGIIGADMIFCGLSFRHCAF